jgi:aspartate racemase
MKKLGLVGGVGYLSTLEYYRYLNEGYQNRVSPHCVSNDNPPMVIESLNLATAYSLVERKDWKGFADLFINAIRVLENAGADFAAIAANTAHIVLEEIQAESNIPIIGIVDETCKRAIELGCNKLIIFGTGFTMNSGMYEAKCKQYGLEAIVPNEEDRQSIHNIIFPNKKH